MRRRLTSALLVLVLLAGIGLMAYPFAADQITRIWNRRAMEKNGEALRAMQELERRRLLKSAEDYNESLTGGVRDAFSAASGLEDEAYMALLNAAGDGIMGELSIPEIGADMPIYHSTDPAVLRLGAGHVYGTSLPVGGEGTHCALAAHRGLPSARLFTDLPRLEVGDRFLIRVAGQTLTYEVDQVLTVLPEETQHLAAEPGKDLVTLITCTPYGVNTHRLLVRGARVREEGES